MSGNDFTEPVRSVKPFRIEPLTAYPKEYLDEILNLSDYQWDKWHRRGLKRLNMNKKEAYYLGKNILTCWETDD